VIARTRSSRMTVARRLDRLSRRNLRVERVVADMAGGLTLHRGSIASGVFGGRCPTVDWSTTR
jgi:hypothetical protein